jgi:hypothetical protein
MLGSKRERWSCYRNCQQFATARAIRIQSFVFRELLARFFVQSRFVDFSAQTKRNFPRFDFLRLADLHFDRNGADDRHPVAVIDDALQDSHYISAALFKLLFQNWACGAVIDVARVAALNGLDGVPSIISLM